MTEPRPSVKRFVSAVVRAELTRGQGAQDLAERMTKRIHEELRKLIGPAGLDVLLARSVARAQPDHPILAGITAGAGGALLGLDASAHDAAALEEAAAAIVTHFIEILINLIGEDLAMRLLRDVWPIVVEKDER